jgi:hypothetical protein
MEPWRFALSEKLNPKPHRSEKLNPNPFPAPYLNQKKQFAKFFSLILNLAL